MRFSVGYRVMPGDPDFFADIVEDYRERVDEVYFAWPEDPSGRTPVPASALSQLLEEIAHIASLGVGLNLLFNASCYGDAALSASLRDHVVELVSRLSEAGLTAVTTMSPVIARAVRAAFPHLDVRASVNMRLGTVRAMEYVSGLFDSYNVQREYNRRPDRLSELGKWAGENGKKLHVLVNSGCLSFCSFQTFHDNVVAHEAGVNRNRNVAAAPTLCRELYSDRGRWPAFLQGSWIRPEDIAKHRAFFDGGYKIAARMHDNPRMVIDAYAKGRYYGNLLDLMEPGFGPVFAPHVVDNRRFPSDWFSSTTGCSSDCARCTYCADTLERVLVDVDTLAGARREEAVT